MGSNQSLIRRQRMLTLQTITKGNRIKSWLPHLVPPPWLGAYFPFISLHIFYLCVSELCKQEPLWLNRSRNFQELSISEAVEGNHQSPYHYQASSSGVRDHHQYRGYTQDQTLAYHSHSYPQPQYHRQYNRQSGCPSARFTSRLFISKHSRQSTSTHRGSFRSRFSH